MNLLSRLVRATGARSPLGSLVNRRTAYWTLCVAVLLCGHVSARAQSLRQDLYSTNGQVSAMAVSGNLIYIGGNFGHVGPVTGPGAFVDGATGQPVEPIGLVFGTSIDAAVSDGAGGFYVGGSFTSINGVLRSNLAHIRADNTVSDWNPSPDYRVRALLVSGSILYVGGDFGLIGGATRSCIAALDITTGLATSWNPVANDIVRSLALGGSTLYVGGAFTNIGGANRNKFAALDVTTGNATAFNPGPNADVLAIAVSGSTVYAGGQFTTIAFNFRNYFAALDATTGSLKPFNPNPDGYVYALRMSGSLLYFGGGFRLFAGAARNGLGALDVTSESVTAWNPTGNSLSIIYAMDLNGSTLYVAGNFFSLGGFARRNLAAVDATTGSVTPWNPSAAEVMGAVAVSGTAVYVGGGVLGTTCRSIGGAARNRLAAIDLTTGKVTGWNPDANDRVRSLALSGSTVYAAGNFGYIGGQERHFIAAIDASTGLPTAWNPGDNGPIYEVAVSGSTVYAAGQFTRIGGQIRNYIAALNMTTGNATAWNPNPNSIVYALAVDGSTVYAGGLFTSIGGPTRHYIAALDAATGNATAWNPTAGGIVYELLVSGSTVYVGGGFDFIGGAARKRIAAVDAFTGSATAFDPNASAPIGCSVQALALGGSVVYAGGDFTTIGGQAKNGIAALDAAMGSVLAWNPAGSFSNGGVLGVHGSTVYIGGSFGSGLPNDYYRNFAGLSDATVDVAPGLPKHSSLALASRPNPFRGTTNLEFNLPRASDVTLSVYDISGREVARLADQKPFSPGAHQIRFDGGHLPSGLYVCLLRAGAVSTAQRIVRMR